MILDITYDKKFILLTSLTPYEMSLLRKVFTVEMKNAWLLKKKSSLIDTERTYITELGYMPAGLWMDLIKVCKEYNLYLEYTQEFINYTNTFTTLTYDEFEKYIQETFEGAEFPNGTPFYPYKYQIEAAWNLLRFKKSTAEISTSAGKTLIAFMIFKYLVDRCNTDKILYIVPSVDLATQSAEKYELYESYLKNHNHNWTIGILKAGLKKAEKEAVNSCNILFATFQSLANKPKEFFDRFTSLIEDETHHISTSIIKTIANCENLDYSLGFTGTYPKEGTIENMNIKSYIGPKVYTLTSDALINEEKQATPIYIVFQFLNWANKEDKQMLWQARNMKSNGSANIDYTLGNKLLKHEQKYINSSGKRLKHICDMAIKMAHNTLILFGDIKGGYGKRIADYIKQYSDKQVFYIDGSTSTDAREYYKKMCEEDTTGNTILVASIGTFGEGIDICNIWSIFLVNSAKSERIIRQICGRGFRKYPGKDKTIIYDFVDDLRYTETGKYNDNYIWSHYKERKKIYKEQNFPTYEQTFNLQDTVFGFN